MFTSIAGRAVVVTGGTRGIGKGIASVFARNGARVLITGRDSDVARAAAEELDALAEDPGEVSFIQADVSSREDCRRMAANAIERLGGIDVLCANAGRLPRQPAGRHDRGPARPGARGQPEGHGVLGPGLPARAAALGPRPGHPHLVDHRADHRLPGLDRIRREQGRPAGLHADRRHRAGSQPRHGQRDPAGQHRHRRPGRARRGLRGEDGSPRSRCAAWAASTTSATPRCSWPPTRRATSPGRRS